MRLESRDAAHTCKFAFVCACVFVCAVACCVDVRARSHAGVGVEVTIVATFTNKCEFADARLHSPYMHACKHILALNHVGERLRQRLRLRLHLLPATFRVRLFLCGCGCACVLFGACAGTWSVK